MMHNIHFEDGVENIRDIIYNRLLPSGCTCEIADDIIIVCLDIYFAADIFKYYGGKIIFGIVSYEAHKPWYDVETKEVSKEDCEMLAPRVRIALRRQSLYDFFLQKSKQIYSYSDIFP